MKYFTLFFFSILLAILNINSVKGQEKTIIIADSTFVNLKDYNTDIIYDMKYATSDNFLKSKVYDCPACYLRLKTVKALIAAQASFQKLGYTIKIFDCYRPLSIQKRMWKIVPNPSYVANPATGSIHNRGGAVDLTLVDKNGVEVDFGTTFDFFGKEASHSYKNLDKKIRNKRKFLRKVMEENGFKAFESEWWHYNFSGALGDKVSDFTWECN